MLFRSTQKLTEQEIKSIQELQDKFMNVTMQFGQIKIERTIIEEQLKNLDVMESKITSDYNTLRQEEIKIVEDLKQKYGEGEINLETGEFISVK